jgi:hypothetical protein
MKRRSLVLMLAGAASVFMFFAGNVAADPGPAFEEAAR